MSALSHLKSEADGCRRCDIWRCGGRVVFGEGPPHARLMLIGEQPGHEEDLAGRPFVGPAGRLLDAAISEAGLSRADIYVSNAVKHFKFVQRGKRRLHQKPTNSEIDICKWWLQQEIEIVRPKVIVALGASAVRALFGKTMPIQANRGKSFSIPPAATGFITLHPSFALRQRESDRRAALSRQLAADLKQAAALL
ncbi:MAG TPA: UdgX family uracil-DNA binding protein [Dongiaceae bacterium]|nr:UdgX family uracil-DNA binding protein [Dongiaceae bacterium]